MSVLYDYLLIDNGKRKEPAKSVHWSAEGGIAPLSADSKQVSKSELMDPTEKGKRKMTNATAVTFGFPADTTKPTSLAHNLDEHSSQQQREEETVVLINNDTN